MNRKVKKGSALVTVMLFSVLFLAISSVSVMAVVNTMKGNSGEEQYQTLYYEAEAGVERALAHANKGDLDSLGDYDPGTNLPVYGFDISSDSNMISKVEVVIKNTGDLNPDYDPTYNPANDPGMVNIHKKNKYLRRYLLVESTATLKGGTSSRKITVKLRNTIFNNDLFKYTICGEAVDSYSNGTFFGPGSNINSSIIPANITQGGAGVTGDVEGAQFILPNLDKMAKSTSPITLTGKPNQLLAQLNAMNSTTGPVFKYTIPTFSPNAAYTGKFGVTNYDVYLVNSDELIMNVVADGAGATFSNGTIIICTGDVKLKGSAFMIVHSSIIAKSIASTMTGAVTISYPPYGTPWSTLDDEDLKLVNDVINSKSSNWFVDDGSIGGSTALEPSDFE